MNDEKLKPVEEQLAPLLGGYFLTSSLRQLNLNFFSQYFQKLLIFSQMLKFQVLDHQGLKGSLLRVGSFECKKF